MAKPEEILKGLWSFPIMLPENPLKWLNCYVIKGERNLLIDTGFNQETCRNDLFAGMKELGLRPENTDVFLSHLHSDHTGNAAVLDKLGYRILMGSTDYKGFELAPEIRYADSFRRFLLEGMPKEILARCNSDNPAIRFHSDEFKAAPLNAGDELAYGDFNLQCIATPGHTPGHICLYDSARKVIFLGDHVLFDISPNICAWPQMEDSLGAYLDSLQFVRELPVELALPAHRNIGNVSLQERVDQLLEHHRRRLHETECVVKEAGEIDAYRVAGRIAWKIRARNWDEFPAAQKSFAVGETLAHLDYLVKRGRLCRNADSNGNVTYTGK